MSEPGESPPQPSAPVGTQDNQEKFTRTFDQPVRKVKRGLKA